MKPPFFSIGFQTDLFPSASHWFVFQVCWHSLVRTKDLPEIIVFLAFGLFSWHFLCSNCYSSFFFILNNYIDLIPQFFSGSLSMSFRIPKQFLMFSLKDHYHGQWLACFFQFSFLTLLQVDMELEHEQFVISYAVSPWLRICCYNPTLPPPCTLISTYVFCPVISMYIHICPITGLTEIGKSYFIHFLGPYSPIKLSSIFPVLVFQFLTISSTFLACPVNVRLDFIIKFINLRQRHAMSRAHCP